LQMAHTSEGGFQFRGSFGGSPVIWRIYCERTKE